MTGQRDIERTLDAWFVDGPTVMPDRLFDAVLDQVGHTRQRPLALLNLRRLREMNPKIRLYTVLAAALLVVVAAIAVIGGGTQSQVRSTDGPTAGPSNGPTTVPSTAAAVEAPADLVATWMGGHHPGVSGDADVGVTLVFDGSQFWMTPSNQSLQHNLLADITSADADSVRLVNPRTVDGCNAGDAGEYGWTVSASGRTLELVLVSDRCSSRSQAVPGTYWRMDCPTPDDNCLGPLDAGTYGSQFIDPFVGLGETWSPRFGAVTYTVPDGWVNVDDWPTTFTLAPQNAPGETALFVLSDVVAASDACGQTQATSVGETAEDLATWVAGLAGVNATAPEHVTVGGLNGWRVDVSLKPSYAKVCDDGAFVSRGLFTDRDTDEGFSWTLTPGMRMRLYFGALDDGRAMVVSIQSDQTGAFYDTFLAEGTSIVESFSIPPG
jgi:hypothetical protein